MPIPVHYRRHRIPVHLGHLSEQTTRFKFCEAAATLESFSSAQSVSGHMTSPPTITLYFRLDPFRLSTLSTKAGSSAQVCAVDILHHYVELSAEGEGIMDLQVCDRGNNASIIDQLPAFTTPGWPRSFIRLRTCFG